MSNPVELKSSPVADNLPVYRILIVDDSEADRMTYERYLSMSDLNTSQVLISESGEEGLALCGQYLPDVILLDYRLPDIDGLEFLELLAQTLSPPPPVIMLTGQGSEKVAVEAMKMGAKDYLVKGSLDAGYLAQAIRRVMTQQQLVRTINRQRQQQQLMASISLRISHALDLETSLHIAVDGARALLECDRTLIYQFQPDLNGRIVAESVVEGYSISLGAEIKDTCFVEQGAERYRHGHKTIVADVLNAGLTTCHLNMLQEFQVRANLVVPILLLASAASPNTRLWGLLIAHDCQQPRNWQDTELSLLDDLSVQLAIAVQQGQLISTLKERAVALAKVNRNLRHATNLLKSRNQELDEFAYIASHDLKAPLRAIDNLSQWLQEDIGDMIPPENQQQLVLMQSRVRRLENFIDGLLQYSRAGRQSLEAKPLSSIQLLQEILEGLSRPPQMTIRLPESGPTLITERLLLQQVLANLLSNAIKYHHRDDGCITVSLEERENEVEFSVADDGPGIEPEYHERIFGVFQTLASRDTLESTGIGLSIVKKIVETQGGKIGLVSQPGEGSTFIFTWPKSSARL